MAKLGLLDGGLMQLEGKLLTDVAGIDCCCLPGGCPTFAQVVAQCSPTLTASISGLDIEQVQGILCDIPRAFAIPMVLDNTAGDLYRGSLSQPQAGGVCGFTVTGRIFCLPGPAMRFNMSMTTVGCSGTVGVGWVALLAGVCPPSVGWFAFPIVFTAFCYVDNGSAPVVTFT